VEAIVASSGLEWPRGVEIEVRREGEAGEEAGRAEAITERLPPDTFGLAASAQLKQGLAPLLYREAGKGLGKAGKTGRDGERRGRERGKAGKLTGKNG
jgi:hypothetical protein